MAKKADSAVKKAAGKSSPKAEFVQRIIELNKKKLSITMAAKAECKPLEADIKQVKKEAKAEGFDVQEIMAAVEHCKATEKLNRLREEVEDIDSYDQLLLDLGPLAGTPMGEFIAVEAGKADESSKPFVSEAPVGGVTAH